MREDHSEDTLGTQQAGLPSAQRSKTLLDYRRAMLRRRAALGTMYAASAVLFMFPWLMDRRRRESPLQAGNGEASQRSPEEAVVSYPGAEASAGAENDMPERLHAGRASTSPSEPPRPEAQVSALADAASPRDPAPVRRTDLILPGAPPSDHPAVIAADAVVLFRGPIFNETMGQGGHVTLLIRKKVSTDAITARFDASQGLSGTGQLAGRVSRTGRVIASGQLMMGKNPFLCDLVGTFNGNTLIGSASFVRSGNSRVYLSRFNLVRA